MEQKTFGASPEIWDAFARLALADMRPIVSDPSVPLRREWLNGKIVPQGDSYSKIPSRLYRHNDLYCVSGFPGWQKYIAIPEDIMQWRQDPNNGVGLVANAIKAIDIDIDDPELEKEVEDWILDWFMCELPYRYRENSPRKMFIYRLTHEEHGRSKTIVNFRQEFLKNVDKAAVEFLFDRSFFVAGGMHKTGVMQYWHGVPEIYEEIPSIAIDVVVKMIREFGLKYGDKFKFGEITPETQRNLKDIKQDDPLYGYVLESDWYMGQAPDGKVFVKCPWEDTHSTHTGKLDETVFFPEGLGGKHASFHCMHTTHGEKNIEDFKDAIGYVDPDFPIIEERPALLLQDRNKKGIAPPSMYNIGKAMDWMQGYEFSIRRDTFDETHYVRSAATSNRWRVRTDEDLAYLMSDMSQLCQMADPPMTKLRLAMDAQADKNKFDSAREWLLTLRWDGKNRIPDLIQAMATPHTSYSTTVCAYMLTAMAGRGLNLYGNGVQADMTLVFAGQEGARKSTFIQALAPRPEWHGIVDLNMRDDDATRLIKGKVILEFAELRGLLSRSSESIKAWLTMPFDEYVPKYRDQARKIIRRCLFFGTTNNYKFLPERATNRRWLPVYVSEYAGIDDFMDTEWVRDNRLQLWAQGVEMYRESGVMFKQAESMAIPYRESATMSSVAEERVKQWIKDTQIDKFTILDVIDGCGLKNQHYTYIVEMILMKLGYKEDGGVYSKVNPFLDIDEGDEV